MAKESLSQEHLIQSDKRFLLVLWLLFAMSLGLSQMYGTLGLALAAGLPIALVPSLLIFIKPGALIGFFALLPGLARDRWRRSPS